MAGVYGVCEIWLHQMGYEYVIYTDDISGVSVCVGVVCCVVLCLLLYKQSQNKCWHVNLKLVHQELNL